MKTKISPEELISFAYEELDAAGMERVQRALDTSPDMQRELDVLLQTRNVLANGEHDVPEMPGMIRLPEPEQRSAAAHVLPLYQQGWFLKLAATAAVLLIVFAGARISGLNITSQNGVTTIRFGDAVTVVPEPVETPVDVEKLLAEFRAEQERFMANLADSAQIRQQKSLDKAMLAFSGYLEKRRIDDLQMLATSLDEIQRFNDDRHFEMALLIDQMINFMNQEMYTTNYR